jgi:hypothetical protein
MTHAERQAQRRAKHAAPVPPARRVFGLRTPRLSPDEALWICRCAWTTRARRPQPHRAHSSK